MKAKHRKRISRIEERLAELDALNAVLGNAFDARIERIKAIEQRLDELGARLTAACCNSDGRIKRLSDVEAKVERILNWLSNIELRQRDLDERVKRISRPSVVEVD